MTKIIMPQMGESVVEGTVARWLVHEGDPVSQDQSIVEVSTDKVDVEIPSPATGILIKILVPEGTTVAVGCELAVIEDVSGQEKIPPSTLDVGQKKITPVAPVAPVFPHPPSASFAAASPVVRRLAEEYQVDLFRVQGSGTGGRITKQDVLRFVGKEKEVDRPGPASPTTPPMGPPTLREEDTPAENTEETEFTEYKVPRYEPQEGDQVMPFSRLRKRIAEHMVYSKRVAPHVTTVAEVDFSRVVPLRDEKKRILKASSGLDLTFLPFVVSATLQAISVYPTMNASVVGESLVIRKDVHMGIAVETSKGLIVSVIRHAHKKSLIQIAQEASTLARKAREGTLTPDEVTGGSFTLTNPGKTGNLFGTPIIFQPQVGIIRMGEVNKRPVVIEAEGGDTLAIHPMMYLALSYDHRVIDGALANLFLHRIKEVIEEARFSL